MLPLSTELVAVSSPSETSTVRWQPPTHPHGKPRQKRHHHKSRDGCSACRRRRVKCDEQKPRCTACIKKDCECKYAQGPVNNDEFTFRLHPATALVPDHFASTDVEFFVENSLELLTLTGSELTGCTLPPAHYASFWKLLLLPVAYQEPLVMEMVSIFAKRNYIALTTSPTQLTDHLRLGMLRTMSRIVGTCSPDVIIIGAMTFFAYERLNSADTGEEPADQYHVHYDALMRMMPKGSDSVVAQLIPVIRFTWSMMLYLKKVGKGTTILVPDHFQSSEEARACFAQFLEISDVSSALETWSQATLQLYKDKRGNDWAGSKVLLAMLSEAQIFRTALRLIVQKQRMPGYLPP